MERQYYDGKISSSEFLDQACHFYDSWTVHTLEDAWNEEYGPYIMQIDEPRAAEGYDALNEEAGLEPVEIPDDLPAPGVLPLPPPPQQQQPGERRFRACAVCYS